METIKEAAIDYKSDIEGSDRERQAAYDGFIDGANHIMSLPLSDRLTAEERKQIKGAFAMFLKFKERADLYERKTFELGYYQGILRAYCDIFGKSMFAEEGGSDA